MLGKRRSPSRCGALRGPRPCATRPASRRGILPCRLTPAAPPAPRAASPSGPSARPGRDCGWRSAPPAPAPARSSATPRTPPPAVADVEIAGGLVGQQHAAARWPSPARSPPAAARRPTACPAGAPPARASPNAASSARARGSAAAPRLAGDHLRQHHVLQRGELAEQVMELIDEADAVAADRGALGIAQARRRRGRRTAPCRRRAAPAARPDAAASTCRRPRAPPAPRSRPPAAPGRRRAAPATRRSPLRKLRTTPRSSSGSRVTHGAAPPPGRCAPPASSDTASPAATAPAP